MKQTSQQPQLGSVVIANVTCGVCRAGEPGVVYEEYTLGGRPGWSVIFRRGGHDGFSPDEVERFLTLTARVCPDTARYRFKDVLTLADDHRRGRFDGAFRLAAAAGTAPEPAP